MPMLFDDVTSVVLRRTLDGLALRHKVTSNNIANVDTPNFKGSVVTFEDELRKATSRQDSFQVASTNSRHINRQGTLDLKPAVVTMRDSTMRRDGNNVDIDREMTKLAETTIAYNAVTQFVAKRLGMLRTIINEGRR